MVIIKVANLAFSLISLIKAKGYLAPANASLRRDRGFRKA